MWGLDCEEGWAPKNWCFWTVVLEKTLESPLDCKDIQPVHSEDQPWDFFGRNDAKAETPVLRPPHEKSWLFGKDFDAGKDWGQEKKGMTEDEMAGWHHWLDGRESEWTPGDGDEQGALACCNSWGRRVRHDWVTDLNWTELLLLSFLNVELVVNSSAGTHISLISGNAKKRLADWEFSTWSLSISYPGGAEGSNPGLGRSPGEGNGNHFSIPA